MVGRVKKFGPFNSTERRKVLHCNSVLHFGGYKEVMLQLAYSLQDEDLRNLQSDSLTHTGWPTFISILFCYGIYTKKVENQLKCKVMVYSIW